MMKLPIGWILPLALIAIFLSVGCAKTGYAEHDPDFDLDLEVLHFTARSGEVVESQTVQLLEAHGLNHPWRVQAQHPWVLVEPRRGDGPGQVVVGVNTGSLAPGLHRSELRFVPDLSEAGQGEAVLVVELEISDAGWQALGAIFAGDVRAAGWDPINPDRLLVGTEHNHLFLSSDGGASFVPVNLDVLGTDCNPYISDIHMLASGRVYLSVYQSSDSLGGVYRSDDRGTTWAPSSLVNLKIGSLMVFDDEHLLAAGDALWRSDDGGANWQELTAPGTTHFVAPHPSDPSQAVIGGDAGALYLTDGTVFTTLDTGLTEAVQDFAVLDDGTWLVRESVVTDHRAILKRSTNAGLGWQDCLGTALPERLSGYPYQMFAAGSDLFIASKEIYRSRDAGDTFHLVGEDFEKLTAVDKYFGGLAHPSGTLFFHEASGLLRLDPSTNHLMQLPLMDFAVRSISWHALSGRLQGVTSTGGVFSMDAQGSTLGLGGSGLSTTTFRSFSADPRSSLVMLAGADGSGLYRSTDGGQNWLHDPLGTEDLSYVRDIEWDHENPDIIWVAGNYQGLWVSEDGGLSFVHILEDEYVTQVAPIGGRQALINWDGVQRISLDTGVVEPLLEAYTPDLLTRTVDGTIYYGDDSYNLHRSTDNGQTFSELPFGSGLHPRALVVDPTDPNRLWLGYDSGLFESRDAGQSFDEVNAPFPVESLTYDPNGQQLFVGTVGGGVYRYLPEP
ncbi:MAG: hypothetical protein JRF33_09570 [Deltaproteobacteria bacterium]|nr:hypothetical protein [Deltaproteobacteria bacterium]